MTEHYMLQTYLRISEHFYVHLYETRHNVGEVVMTIWRQLDKAVNTNSE